MSFVYLLFISLFYFILFYFIYLFIFRVGGWVLVGVCGVVVGGVNMQ